jgi:hypothetical protein
MHPAKRQFLRAFLVVIAARITVSRKENGCWCSAWDDIGNSGFSYSWSANRAQSRFPHLRNFFRR